MALNFQPYNDASGRETRARWAQSLDGIFQAYQQARQGGRMDQAAALQAQLAQQQLAAGQRASQMADVQETAQFGDKLSNFTPQQIGQAGQGIQPQGPGLPADQMRLQKLAEGFHAISQKQSLGVREKESEIKVNEARAKALGEQQVYVDPDTGRQIVVPKGAKLIPRAPKGGKAATNQDLESAMELYETAKEGLISGLGGSETGSIVGRLPAITAKQQIAKGSVAAMAPVLKQIFRTAGEGVFTDRDQQLLLDMIPTRTELPEARTAMIANIDAIVKAKIKSGMRQASPDGSSQPSAVAAPINLTGAKAARLAELRAKAGR